MALASILFAAGKGKRLRPLTDRIPKPALPLLDVPLGGFALAALGAALRPTLVNVSHLPAETEAALRPFGDFHVFHEPDPLGTAGTISALRDELAETVVTLNSDALLDLDPAELLEDHRARGAPATIAVRAVETGADVKATEGRVTGFVDRRRNPRAPGFQFLGLAAFQTGMLRSLSLSSPGGLGEQILAPLASGGLLHAFVHDGYFADVGTPARYLAASLDVLHGSGPSLPKPCPGRMVEVDGGLAYIGPGATTTPESLGPGAIVLADANVGGSARVEGALIMPGETLMSGELRNAIWFEGRPLQV